MEILGLAMMTMVVLGCILYELFLAPTLFDNLPEPERIDMEVEAAVSLSRTDIYTLLESVPDSNEKLSAKLREALTHVERALPVYGGGSTIKPKETK